MHSTLPSLSNSVVTFVAETLIPDSISSRCPPRPPSRIEQVIRKNDLTASLGLGSNERPLSQSRETKRTRGTKSRPSSRTERRDTMSSSSWNLSRDSGESTELDHLPLEDLYISCGDPEHRPVSAGWASSGLSSRKRVEPRRPVTAQSPRSARYLGPNISEENVQEQVNALVRSMGGETPTMTIQSPRFHYRSSRSQVVSSGLSLSGSAATLHAERQPKSLWISSVSNDVEKADSHGQKQDSHEDPHRRVSGQNADSNSIPDLSKNSVGNHSIPKLDFSTLGSNTSVELSHSFAEDQKKETSSSVRFRSFPLLEDDNKQHRRAIVPKLTIPHSARACRHIEPSSTVVPVSARVIRDPWADSASRSARSVPSVQSTDVRSSARSKLSNSVDHADVGYQPSSLCNPSEILQTENTLFGKHSHARVVLLPSSRISTMSQTTNLEMPNRIAYVSGTGPDSQNSRSRILTPRIRPFSSGMMCKFYSDSSSDMVLHAVNQHFAELQHQSGVLITRPPSAPAGFDFSASQRKNKYTTGESHRPMSNRLTQRSKREGQIPPKPVVLCSQQLDVDSTCPDSPGGMSGIGLDGWGADVDGKPHLSQVSVLSSLSRSTSNKNSNTVVPPELYLTKVVAEHAGPRIHVPSAEKSRQKIKKSSRSAYSRGIDISSLRMEAHRIADEDISSYRDRTLVSYRGEMDNKDRCWSSKSSSASSFSDRVDGTETQEHDRYGHDKFSIQSDDRSSDEMSGLSAVHDNLEDSTEEGQDDEEVFSLSETSKDEVHQNLAAYMAPTSSFSVEAWEKPMAWEMIPSSQDEFEDSTERYVSESAPLEGEDEVVEVHDKQDSVQCIPGSSVVQEANEVENQDEERVKHEIGSEIPEHSVEISSLESNKTPQLDSDPHPPLSDKRRKRKKNFLKRMVREEKSRLKAAQHRADEYRKLWEQQFLATHPPFVGSRMSTPADDNPPVAQTISSDPHEGIMSSPVHSELAEEEKRNRLLEFLFREEIDDWKWRKQRRSKKPEHQSSPPEEFTDSHQLESSGALSFHRKHQHSYSSHSFSEHSDVDDVEESRDVPVQETLSPLPKIPKLPLDALFLHQADSPIKHTQSVGESPGSMYLKMFEVGHTPGSSPRTIRTNVSPSLSPRDQLAASAPVTERQRNDPRSMYHSPPCSITFAESVSPSCSLQNTSRSQYSEMYSNFDSVTSCSIDSPHAKASSRRPQEQQLTIPPPPLSTHERERQRRLVAMRSAELDDSARSARTPLDTSATDIASPWNPSRQVREDARSQVTWRSRSNEKRNPDSSNIDSRSRNDLDNTIDPLPALEVNQEHVEAVAHARLDTPSLDRQESVQHMLKDVRRRYRPVASPVSAGSSPSHLLSPSSPGERNVRDDVPSPGNPTGISPNATPVPEEMDSNEDDLSHLVALSLLSRVSESDMIRIRSFVDPSRRSHAGRARSPSSIQIVPSLALSSSSISDEKRDERKKKITPRREHSEGIRAPLRKRRHRVSEKRKLAKQKEFEERWEQVMHRKFQLDDLEILRVLAEAKYLKDESLHRIFHEPISELIDLIPHNLSPRHLATASSNEEVHEKRRPLLASVTEIGFNSQSSPRKKTTHDRGTPRSWTGSLGTMHPSSSQILHGFQSKKDIPQPPRIPREAGSSTPRSRSNGKLFMLSGSKKRVYSTNL